MTDEQKELVRRIGALADQADQVARAIDGHRVRTHVGGGAHSNVWAYPNRVTAISRIGTVLRDFHSQYLTAFAVLPAALQKQL